MPKSKRKKTSSPRNQSFDATSENPRRRGKAKRTRQLDKPLTPATTPLPESDAKPNKKSLAARKERWRLFRTEIANAPTKQRKVFKIWQLLEERKHRRCTKGNEPPPGLLNQVKAAEQRVWRHSQALLLRKQGRLALKREGRPVELYAVTLARAPWILETLDPAILLVIRKQVQRQAKRLPWPYVVTGIIDVGPFRDDLTGVTGWAFHAHLTIQLGIADFKVGKQAIKKAFPYKPESDRGVPKPRLIVEIYDSRGWEQYQDKILQFGGVRQRIVRVDQKTGLRLDAHKPELSKQQQDELVAFMARIDFNDLAIWVGHRRYGNRVLPMPCNRSKK